MDAQKLNQNIVEQGLLKDQAGKHILRQSRSLNSKNFIEKAPNHGEGSSVPLKYTVATYTGMPKITLGTALLTLKKYIFIYSRISHFLLFFFTINNEHIQKPF